MRNNITSPTVLNSYLSAYGTACGMKDAAKDYERQRLAEIVLYAHSIPMAERQRAYNEFVQAYATAKHVKCFNSQRAVSPKKGFNFCGLIIGRETNADDTARKTMQARLYVLEERTPEAAKALAAKLMAPRVKTIASRKDITAKRAKMLASWTPAELRDALAQAMKIRAKAQA